MSASVTETTEPLPFQYRVTVKAGGEVGIDVGDDFRRSDAYENSVGGITEQIGLDMAMKGMQFMGLSHEERRMLCALAIKTADGDDE